MEGRGGGAPKSRRRRSLAPRSSLLAEKVWALPVDSLGGTCSPRPSSALRQQGTPRQSSRGSLEQVLEERSRSRVVGVWSPLPQSLIDVFGGALEERSRARVCAAAVHLALSAGVSCIDGAECLLPPSSPCLARSGDASTLNGAKSLPLTFLARRIVAGRAWPSPRQERGPRCPARRLSSAVCAACLLSSIRCVCEESAAASHSTSSRSLEETDDKTPAAARTPSFPRPER